MKKILLASTMLVGTAGFAAADVSFTGNAYVGVAYVFSGAASVDYSVSFRAGMMTTTDYGLEVGAGVVVVTPSYNIVKDPDDADFATISNYTTSAGVAGTAATIIAPASNIYMSGSWGKVDVAYDNDSDDSNATPGDWDITATYTNTWGNFGLEVYGVYAPAGATTATTSGDFGAKGTYTFGDYSVWVGYGYNRFDATNAGVSHNVMAGVSASLGSFSANADVEYDITNKVFGWHVDATYATGPYSVTAFINDGLNYGVQGAYSLGGGVSINAGYAGVQGGANLVYAGVSMAF